MSDPAKMILPKVADTRTKGKDLIPKWEEIPDEFKKPNNKYVKFINEWFFSGVDAARLIAKDGIDRRKAITHVKNCMNSWEIKHEHKEAGCAYLLSLWFDLDKKEDCQSHD
jgi:hypothetical protein